LLKDKDNSTYAFSIIPISCTSEKNSGNAKDARADGVTIDKWGTVYVAGMGIDGNNTTHWIVRKSTDSGTTWSNMVDYNLVAGGAAMAYVIEADPWGNVWSGGYAVGDDNNQHWIVRKLPCVLEKEE